MVECCSTELTSANIYDDDDADKIPQHTPTQTHTCAVPRGMNANCLRATNIRLQATWRLSQTHVVPLVELVKFLIRQIRYLAIAFDQRGTNWTSNWLTSFNYIAVWKHRKQEKIQAQSKFLCCLFFVSAFKGSHSRGSWQVLSVPLKAAIAEDRDKYCQCL